MKLLESTETLERIGEAIGKIFASLVIVALVWITLDTILHWH
jgi:TRAP-type mannitol/chloroaromatic compound transport system permease small subunit